MHYMPWFETPATSAEPNDWGYHWKFNNRNPNVVDANGRRQIASHYYPKIGPYASRDPHVIEYHLLLMKYAGVDGVLIDWYGVAGHERRHRQPAHQLQRHRRPRRRLRPQVRRRARGSLLDGRRRRRQSTPDINKAKANVAYLKNNYFNNPQYIRQNAGADPLVAVFGPITFHHAGPVDADPRRSGRARRFPDAVVPKWTTPARTPTASTRGSTRTPQRTHLQHQSDFYQLRTPTLGTAGGVAYPGFNDYYQEGGTNTVIGFEIPHNNGAHARRDRSLSPARTRPRSTFCSSPPGTTSAKARCSSRRSRRDSTISYSCSSSPACRTRSRSSSSSIASTAHASRT